MYRLILAAMVVIFSSGIAFSQSAPDTPSGPETDAPLAPSSQQDKPKNNGAMHRHRPVLDRSAHFRYHNRGVTIDITCATGEPIEECARIFLQALDRVLPDDNGARKSDSDRNKNDFDRPDENDDEY